MDINSKLSPPHFFNPSDFLESLDRMIGSFFLKECERIATLEPWVDGEELETRAEEITNQYFYFKASERLNFYLNDNGWRFGLE